MAQDFLSGVRTGASLGGMIQGNISRRKEEKRQAQFDKKRLTDMDINIALKQARLKKARMAIESTAQGRNPSDPYDRYTQLYSRHAEETSKAQQALELAQRRPWSHPCRPAENVGSGKRGSEAVSRL